MRNAARQIDFGGPDREQPDHIANERRELLTAEDVAELLGMSVDWIWAQTRAGNIPSISLGRYRRYRRHAIEEWLRELESRPSSTRSGRALTRQRSK